MRADSIASEFNRGSRLVHNTICRGVGPKTKALALPSGPESPHSRQVMMRVSNEDASVTALADRDFSSASFKLVHWVNREIVYDTFKDMVGIRTWTPFSVGIKSPELSVDCIKCCALSHMPCLLLWLWWRKYLSLAYSPSYDSYLGGSTSTTLLEIYQWHQLHFSTDFCIFHCDWLYHCTLRDPTVEYTPSLQSIYLS